MSRFTLLIIIILAAPLILGVGCATKKTTRQIQPSASGNATSTASSTISGFGSGGFEGSVKVNVAVQGYTVKQTHSGTVKLSQVKTKPGGLFWEGDWEGTRSWQIVDDPSNYDALLAPAKGKVTEVKNNKVESKLKLHLEAGPDGTLSPNSYFENTGANDYVTGAQGYSAYGGEFSKTANVGMNDRAGKGEVIFERQNASELAIRLKNMIPFDYSLQVPGVTYTFDKAVIILKP